MERGAVRPTVLIVAVFTCIVIGSALSQCLTCAPAGTEAAKVTALPQGDLLNPPPEEAPPAAVAKAEEPAPVPEPPPTPDLGDDKYLSITFDKLASYQYVYPDIDSDKPRVEQIPESIQKLGGEKIAIQGFMIPVKLDESQRRVTEFLLVRNQLACCFGVYPKMNEWVHVIMAPGKTSPYAADILITVFGTLHVGELIEEGVVMSLYRMTATEVTEPPVFR